MYTITSEMHSFYNIYFFPIYIWWIEAVSEIRKAEIQSVGL